MQRCRLQDGDVAPPKASPGQPAPPLDIRLTEGHYLFELSESSATSALRERANRRERIVNIRSFLAASALLPAAVACSDNNSGSPTGPVPTDPSGISEAAVAANTWSTRANMPSDRWFVATATFPDGIRGDSLRDRREAICAWHLPGKRGLLWPSFRAL
jgi:hypothetical protein